MHLLDELIHLMFCMISMLMFIIRDMKKLKKRCSFVRSHFDDMSSEQKMNRKV